ncbi:MAG TPA: prepilin peptidase [Longimicrobiales bacterium]|nr:prepilin peptidase [Longimicrobiales bacterium]
MPALASMTDAFVPSHALASSGPLSALLVVVLVPAVWFDVREQRIPNWITAGGLVASLVTRGLLGPESLWLGVLGAGSGFALGILLFASGAMGAGDGKLLTAVGAVLGLDVFLLCLPLVGVFGGLLALAVTVYNGTVIATLLRLRELVFYLLTFGRLGDRRTLTAPGSVSVPYGVAVAAGAATAWLGWGLAL